MNIPMIRQDKVYDVIIIGAGIAGSMIGAILARKGLTVLLTDVNCHPKFAIGESTVGHTSEMIQLIADRYDVPEIGYLSSFRKIKEFVTSSCGVKRGFGFLYHREDGSQYKEESNQFVIPPLLHGLENHLFRQDIDAFLFNTAIKYGADQISDCVIEDIIFSEDEVKVHTKKYGEITCSFVLDGSGFRSVLADKFKLREKPETLHAQTRSIFTHMVDVKPYDNCVPKNFHGMPLPWFQTTLHHCFDGGWMWIIPFNNHVKASNPVCSVGLTLDIEKYPNQGVNPEEEFNSFIKKYPTIANQFSEAKSVRNWVGTGRLQYTSKQAAGHRYFLLPHSAGFIDPLFSRGLAITMDGIFALVPRILEAFEKNNFDPKLFSYPENLILSSIKYADELVHTSFKSFKDYKLWNAWLRIWALGEAGLDQLRILNAKMSFANDKNDKHFTELEEVPYLGMICPNSERFYNLWNETRSLILRAARGEVELDVAENRFYSLFNEAKLISPSIGMGKPGKRIFGASNMENIKSMLWGKLNKDEKVAEYYKFKTLDMLKININNLSELSTKDLKLPVTKY